MKDDAANDSRQPDRVEGALSEGQTLRRIAGRVARLGGWTIDLPERKLTWSDEVCAIHDLPPGHTPTLDEGILLFEPEARDKVRRYVDECALDGTPYDYELPKLTATGRRIWVRGIGEAVRDARGRIIRVQGAFQDITKYRAMEQERRRLEEQLKLTLESITDGFFTVDRDWRFTYLNAEAERMLHRRRADLIGVSMWEAFPDSVGSNFEHQYRLAVREGVTVDFVDYFAPLSKWFHIRAYPSDQGLAGYFLDVTPTRHAEEAIREREVSLLLRDRAIQELSQGILITDPNLVDNPIIYASAGVERITGYRQDELLGRSPRMFQGRDTDLDAVAALHDAIAAERGCTAEILNYRKDGTPFWNAMSINPVRDGTGVLSHFVGVLSDVTDRRNLESQLRQSQKMEAIGRLAGGVAHDFNNLITIVNGYSELVLAMPEASERVREAVHPIREAGERAAGLTQQLLGFSRQSLLQPRVLDLNAVIMETGQMLRRLIGEDIVFTMVLDPAVRRVTVDPSQLNQVLMNLVVNARDAMPRGGTLTIETANVLFDADVRSTQVDCSPGPHVLLSVTDTGCGMTPEVMARVFEPFFTTKGVGKGSGLGLSMVFGIVRQSEGCIFVESVPGVGTSVKVYIPAADEPEPPRLVPEAPFDARGKETILLVEDEEGVRRLVLLNLTENGYTVLTAVDGADALRVVEGHDGGIDLILTDVVMPNMGGPELVSELSARFPRIGVLFMSGYTDDAVVRHGLQHADVAFIQKPYTLSSLSRRVREVLDGVA